MVIAVIGAGVIGSAVAKALVKNAVADKVVATDSRPEQLVELRKAGVETTAGNKKAASMADTVILCVKPKDVKSVVAEIHAEIKNKLVLSLAAAVSLTLLEKAAPKARFVRVMPNLAIVVGEAFVGYCAGANVSDEDKDVVGKILGVMGVCVEVEETQMDAVTALSGCAPGVLAALTEAMVKSGVEIGLPPDLALTSVAQSLVGAGKLLLETKKPPSKIIKMVATPGGVTEEELKELAKYPLTEAFVSSLRVGAEKSRKISHDLVAEGK